jgi:pentatricopeptide repeat protein
LNSEGVVVFDDRLKVRSGNGVSMRTIPSSLGVRLASSVVFVESERDSGDQARELPASSIYAPPVQSTQRARQLPSFSSPKLLIGKVCQALRDTEWGHGTEEALHELGIYFTPSLVNEVLRCQQDVDKAMGFFEYVGRQPYYKHNSRTHAKMLALLGAAKRYDEVHRLVESIQKEHIQLDTQLFNTLIYIYGEANMMDTALETLAAFVKGGGRPTAFTYSSMIQVFMKVGDVENGLSMYRQMLQAKFVPDHTTFNILIDSLAKADQVGNISSMDP